MTDKLWCQMCGKTVGDESFCYLPNCPWCGAVLVEAPVKDGLLEEVLLAKLNRAETMVEKLIEAGSKGDFAEWGHLLMEWKGLK